MGIKSKLKQFFDLEDEEMVWEDPQQEMMTTEAPAEESSNRQFKKNKDNVVSLQSVQQNVKVKLVEPRVYSEVQEIADELKNHRAIVMNLQRVPHDQAKRIVDFLSGTVYAIGGDIQKLGDDAFLCTADNVEVDGAISEMMTD